MKRLRLLSLCLLLAGALGGALASHAFASESTGGSEAEEANEGEEASESEAADSAAFGDGALAMPALTRQGPPEFGQCIKTSHGEYADSTCTEGELAGKGSYEWHAGPDFPTSFVVAAHAAFGATYEDCAKADKYEVEAEAWEHKATEAKTTAKEDREEAERDHKKAEEDPAEAPYWDERAIAFEEKEKEERKVEEKDLKEAARFQAKANSARGSLSKAECQEVITKELEKVKPVKLEPEVLANWYTIECNEVEGSGEYSTVDSRQVVGVSLRFGGCQLKYPEAALEEEEATCQSGTEAGVITPVPLTGELGWIKKYPVAEFKKDKVGIDLKPASGSEVATITCGGTGEHKEHTFTTTVKGAVIHEVKIDKMIEKEVEAVDEENGKQIPEKFEFGEEQVLKAGVEYGSLKLESQAGMELQTALENVTTETKEKEKMEVNARY